MSEPQGFDVERFVPVFNEASAISIASVENVHVVPPEESNFQAGIRAIMDVTANCLTKPLAESERHYVNDRGDIVPSGELATFLSDSGRPGEGHRFVSQGVKPERTGSTADFKMGDGSAIVNPGYAHITIKKGFEIGDHSVLITRSRVGRNVAILSSCVVRAREIKDNSRISGSVGVRLKRDPGSDDGWSVEWREDAFKVPGSRSYGPRVLTKWWSGRTTVVEEP